MQEPKQEQEQNGQIEGAAASDTVALSTRCIAKATPRCFVASTIGKRTTSITTRRVGAY